MDDYKKMSRPGPHRRSVNKPHAVFDLREDGALTALQQNGLKLHQNETVEFLMSENPSTGYSWQFDTKAARGIYELTEIHEDPKFDHRCLPFLHYIFLKY